MNTDIAIYSMHGLNLETASFGSGAWVELKDELGNVSKVSGTWEVLIQIAGQMLGAVMHHAIADGSIRVDVEAVMEVAYGEVARLEKERTRSILEKSNFELRNVPDIATTNVMSTVELEELKREGIDPDYEAGMAVAWDGRTDR